MVSVSDHETKRKKTYSYNTQLRVDLNRSAVVVCGCAGVAGAQGRWGALAVTPRLPKQITAARASAIGRAAGRYLFQRIHTARFFAPRIVPKPEFGGPTTKGIQAFVAKVRPLASRFLKVFFNVLDPSETALCAFEPLFEIRERRRGFRNLFSCRSERRRLGVEFCHDPG